MEESNEIYEKVVSILEEGVKPLEEVYEEKGVVFSVDDIATIAGVFESLHNKLVDYHKELKDGKD